MISISFLKWIILQCNSRDLIGLAAMVYDPLYHARGYFWSDSSGLVRAKQTQQDRAIFLDCFQLNLINPLALAIVGYNTNAASSALRVSLAIIREPL